KDDAARAGQQLAAAQAEVAKWTAAQVNVSLYATRKTLAERKIDCEKTVEAARAASAELDKTRADLAAAENSIADAPERIKARENGVAEATQAIEAANAAVTAAAARMAEKQTITQLAGDFVDKLKTEFAKSPD